MKRNTPTFAIASSATSTAFLAAVAWVTGPGLSDFNAFNERVFGRYYTAGAILMIGLYGLAFAAIAGGAAIAAAIAWRRKEEPRWIKVLATLAALGVPLLVAKLFQRA